MTLSRIEQGEASALEAIESLLGEGCTPRESRRIKMALQTARLPTVKTLPGYDFSFQPSPDRDQVLAPAELEFVARHQCVHRLGPPGMVKSHLAIALGVQAVRAGKSVCIATLAEMVDSMRRAEREGRLSERVRYLARHSVLNVDEIGYLPVGSGVLDEVIGYYQETLLQSPGTSPSASRVAPGPPQCRWPPRRGGIESLHLTL